MPTKPDAPDEYTPVKPQPEVSDYQQERLQELLYEARFAINEDRLTTPDDDNAYLKYSQVLSIDPTHPEANAGISLIVERYLEWALRAAERGQYRRAFDYLAKARSVDELHPNIAAVQKRINDAQNQKQHVYKLDREALKARSDQIIARLHEIGRLAAIHDARVLITAPSDPDGRWIYQQLNDADLKRIRATFELGRPGVRLNY